MLKENFFVTASWELVAISADNYSILYAKISKARYSKGAFYTQDKDGDKGFILINAGKHLYKLNSINGNLAELVWGLVEVGNVLPHLLLIKIK